MSDHETSFPDTPQGCPRCDCEEVGRDGAVRQYECGARWDFDDAEGDYSEPSCEVIVDLRKALEQIANFTRHDRPVIGGLSPNGMVQAIHNTATEALR